ncbi:MAG: putative hydroxymethylpyrimidine transporter CytX [Deltaproteobacteria bacterium]|nr:putative hydroxymethylpyrimidine transporter CytX [Deltaproteobacteria bacterium]
MDIRPTQPGERTLSGLDYLILWAGVAISLAEIWAGGFLAPMGFWMGLWAILLGHVIGNSLMALGGVIGSDHGIMSMVSLRPAFGIRGSGIAAVFNIIQLVGWHSIMLIIGARAGAMIGGPFGGVVAATQFWVILIGAGTLLWALYTGKRVWKVLQTVTMTALVLVVAAMTVVSFRELVPAAAAASGDMPFMTGLDLVIAMPISWMPLVADYSRMSKRTSPAFWNTWWGYFIVSSWMYALGLAATLVTGATDPGFVILQTMGKIGMAVPALIMVIFSTITSDFPDIYSAACSVMNISDRIRPKALMWIAGILSIIVALIFPIDQYENFLLLIGAMFVPLFGVVLTDYFVIRRRRFDVEELYREGGAYWYCRGFHVAAIAAWGAGFAVFEAISRCQYPVGGSIPSMAAAGLLYWLICGIKKGGRRAAL